MPILNGENNSIKSLNAGSNKNKVSMARNRTSMENRGNDTRAIILEAAGKVFAMHPYKAASLRMIAAQGNFYHGLIRYHFPSKEMIFEAVFKEACTSLRQANLQWLTEIASLPPDSGFPLFLDRILHFFHEQPELFQIMTQNMSHDELKSLPGYHHLTEFLSGTRRDFESTFPGLFSSQDLDRFLRSLNALLMHYLGSGPLEAAMLGLEPHGDRYLQWVKKTMVFIFLPLLQSGRTRQTG